MTEQKVRGSCFCGKVTFRVTLPARPEINYCFCRDCRKLTASVFNAYVIVPKAALEFLSGEDNLTGSSLKGDAGYILSGLWVEDLWEFGES
jgi:hypothetical protein